jgi:AraC-like DNA-binding protein
MTRHSTSAGSKLLPSWLEPCLHSTYVQISAEQINADPPFVAAQPHLMTIIDCLHLFEAQDAIAHPEKGLELGRAIPAAAHGLLGFATLSSESLWGAMNTMVRYGTVRNSIFDFRCYKQGKAAVLELRPRLQIGGLEQFIGHATVLALHNVFRAISESVVSDATRLTFPWRAPNLPAELTPLSKAFDFEDHALAIKVPLDIALRPSQNADHELHMRLRMMADDVLAQSLSTTAARVRHILHQKAPAWPSLLDVAEQMGMSKRTLIRKLESEDLSYQMLLDQTRSDLACWLLRRPHLQLSEIAEQVGFSDQACFTKSFQRVKGCTPSQYRADVRRMIERI